MRLRCASCGTMAPVAMHKRGPYFVCAECGRKPVPDWVAYLSAEEAEIVNGTEFDQPERHKTYFGSEIKQA